MSAYPAGVLRAGGGPAGGSIDTEVQRLIDAAEHVRTMPPALERFLKANPTFNRLIAHQVRILQGRSPIPARCEMTIWDRALLIITRNGVDVGRAASVQFFCEHWCDYDPAVDAPTEAMYDKMGFAQLSWDQFANTNSDDPVPDSPRYPSPVMVDRLGARNQAGLKRLVKTYEYAVEEYRAVELLRDDTTLQAAKYLRDTAENAIQYLQETDIDRGKLSEIENMYESAKKVVQSLTGKVRKFDEGYRPQQQQQQGEDDHGEFRAPRGPRGGRLRSYEHESRHAARSSFAYEGRRAASPDPYARQAEYTDRRRRSMSPGGHEARHHSRRGRETEEGIQIKGKSQHGKHHSGVPFGYRMDRVVDRYEPGA